MFIPDLDFCPSRIPAPKTATKEKGQQKFVVLTFFVATYTGITIINNYFIFEQVKKKHWANLKRIYRTKIVIQLSKLWVWDQGSDIREPRSGIRKKPIPDPGSRGSKRIRIRNTEKILTYGYRTSRVSQPRRMATGMMIGEA
jgi:hypothetical protein